MKRRILSVWEINSYVSHLMDEDYLLNNLWLQGEVSNCKYHHSGHIYFTLKDERASINAVMFESDARTLTFKLTEGLKIYANVRISLYEKAGSYQAYVQLVEKQGKGLMYERFEALKAKLLAEGLFAESAKKPIPAFPKKVAVITSRTGAAIKDILKVAKTRNPAIPILIYHAQVQGERAPKELIEALRVANEEKKADVIIIGRGGGSIEDLWAFNDEALARAIYASKIPVVSAVGHEVDFTLSDFVSDLRAATPSAAAEMVFPSQKELEERIGYARRRMNHVIGERIRMAKKQLEAVLSRPIWQDKARICHERVQEIDLLIERLERACLQKISECERRYELAFQKLEKLSPLETLKRGYSVATYDKKPLTSITQVEVEDEIQVTLTDGVLKAKVCGKE